MHRTDQLAPGPWQVLVYDVAVPRRPGLRVRVAGAGRLLLEQAGSRPGGHAATRAWPPSGGSRHWSKLAPTAGADGFVTALDCRS